MSTLPPLDPVLAAAAAAQPALDPLRSAAAAGQRLRHWFGPPSVRRTVMLALVTVLALTAASAYATRYLLLFRVHDYAILNLAGQLREMAGAISLDARQIRKADPTELGAREIDAFRDRLQRQALEFDRIVEGFEKRSLPVDLTGLDGPLTCNWDEQSRAQLARSSAVWKDVRRRLAPALRAQASAADVLAAAAALDSDSERLLDAARALGRSFKLAMQDKLAFVLSFQVAVMVLCAAVGLALLQWLRRRVLLPLEQVERAAGRLMQGELGLQVPVSGDREIAAVAVSLNDLSARLRLLFDVSGRAASGLDTGELMETLLQGVAPVVAVDFIGVAVRADGPSGGWRMHRTAGAGADGLGDGVPLMADASVDSATAALQAAGARAGFGSVYVLPLQDGPHDAALLMFATQRRDGLPEAARGLLRALSDQVRAQLDRTLSTEALVVAAIEGLAKLAESRDPETGDHLVRMSAYSAMLAAELASDPAYALRIDNRYVEDIRRFAPMHDIGKVGIADSILLKPGRLTDEERLEMTLHPSIGGDVLRRCEAQMQARGRSVFRIGIEIAEGHHERWDGTGYPRRIAGESIPLSARIVAVADVLDALTSRRPYKSAWPIEQALATIDADAGKHFDPAVVAALHRCLPAILDFYERHKHI